MEMGGQGRLAALKQRASAGMDRRFILTARCCVYFTMGFALSCARVLEKGAPFGMALVAATAPSLAGVFALVGAALGYLVGSGLDRGIRYVAAAVLSYTVGFVFQEIKLFRSSLFMPTAAALIMALTGFLGSFSMDAGGGMPLAAELFLETALAFGGCYFFRTALSFESCVTESEQLKQTVSLMILASCLLMSISGWMLFGVVSIGRFLALLLLMTSAMKGGMLSGAAVGTVLGLAMDISSPGSRFYTMAYSFSGLLSGVFGKHGRFIFTLSFILSGALAVVCAWSEELYISALFENFCASVIFMLLPHKLLSGIGLILQGMGKGSGELGLRRFVAKRVRNLSEAYGELYDIVNKSVTEPYNDENIARVFDRAADEVCVRCRHKNRCWNAEYVDTLSAMNDASRAMSANGSLTVNDLPGYFREKCVGLPAFVAAVNGELRALSYRRQLKTRLAENRSAAWGQYQDIALVLGNVAEELGSVNGSDPLAERRLMRYMKNIGMDADAAVYRDGGGRLRVVIEGGRLAALTKDADYAEKLSEVVGVKLSAEGNTDGSSRLTLLEAEPLAVSVGIAAMKKRGEKVSGDKGSYFKTDAGVLCVILSDGMGCGDEAAQDSGRVVAILEKFLRSGLDPAVAMKILNSVMLLRDGENWGYATVDLMCVDLFSGETCFYKYGAAPSYVKNGKSIRRIKGESLAPGLSMGEGTAPDIVRMRLKAGSTAIIASDGVIADTDDAWIKELLNRDFEDMKGLARTTLKAAEKLYGTNDDMTVVTVRVEERA